MIAVLPMDGAARRWTLHRPAEQVTEHDLRALPAAAPAAYRDGHIRAYEAPFRDGM